MANAKPLAIRTLDAVRDTKRRDGPTLAVRALPTFINHIKTGQFHR